MQFGGNNYYSAMDYMDNSSIMDSSEPAPTDDEGNPITPDGALNFTHKDIGTTTNPMGNVLESLKARIREGNSRLEFSFIGQGKGNSQQPTPESFGTTERRDIRELLKLNEMKTSTHASVHSQSLAGFTKDGFSPDAQEQVLKEIRKAIDFASEATKGGAIVFHFQEWQRPVSEIQDKGVSSANFKAYASEDKDAQKLVVDNQTGKFVSGISKDQKIYRPKYKTAKDVPGLVGKTDKNGHVLNANDWIDINNDFIPEDYSTDNVDKLFNRVPIFNREKTRFEVETLDWNALKKETDEYNKDKAEKDRLAPEELYARTQLENQALQAMGNSLYHGRQYESEEKTLKELRQKYENYLRIKENTPKEDQWKLASMLPGSGGEGKISDDPEENTKKIIQFYENSLRQIHEASASADVQAQDIRDRAKRLKSVEKYGMEKSAETVSLAAMEAMRKYNSRKDKYGLEEPIFVAPENWDPRFYGSHPDEYIALIKASRNKMKEQLMKEGYDAKKAQELAKNHIKGTLDIGHLNLWRSYFQAKEGESPEKRDKRFNEWLMTQTERLTKGGYVGHIHLADNFGYDDEHLSPGQGNIPMKEFLKRIEAVGIKDIIVEPGSYNATREVPDTMALIGSPIYGVNRRQRFNQVRNAHFGYNAPGFFIAGSYVPSNDWKPWTDLPLE